MATRILFIGPLWLTALMLAGCGMTLTHRVILVTETASAPSAEEQQWQQTVSRFINDHEARLKALEGAKHE